MVTSARIYADIGKESRDLLYKDYESDCRLTLTADTPLGAITYSRTRLGNSFQAGQKTALLKDKIITSDVKWDNFGICGTLSCKLAAGLKTIFSFSAPDQNSSKVEFQYQHGYRAISTSMGLTSNPILNFSGTIGSKDWSLGTGFTCDPATGSVSNSEFGLHCIVTDLTCSLNLGADTAKLSFYHLIKPLTSTAFGYELTHRYSTEMSSLTIGTQHALDPLTMVKGRVENTGKASVVLRRELRANCLFTIHGDVDLRAIKKSINIGFKVYVKV